MEGSRREARERAVSLLYEAELKDQAPAEVLADLPVPPEEFVVDLVGGVGRHRDRIDQLITEHAIDWTLERMPAVDRNILRLAVYELLERPDVPASAVLSEAVELAGRYGTDESSRFVNGLLAAVARDVRPG
ncbi:MAG: transcription antitermination protein NusB [Actinomycetota bacterium]|jgi:N utilization substance protein B|nr:transcription antitermination protein NusB [Actinomycetota bacterium]